ncbi:unnamed protein product, partial [Phaeothamnion confervicola]
EQRLLGAAASTGTASSAGTTAADAAAAAAAASAARGGTVLKRLASAGAGPGRPAVSPVESPDLAASDTKRQNFSARKARALAAKALHGAASLEDARDRLLAHVDGYGPEADVESFLLAIRLPARKLASLSAAAAVATAVAAAEAPGKNGGGAGVGSNTDTKDSGQAAAAALADEAAAANDEPPPPVVVRNGLVLL